MPEIKNNLTYKTENQRKGVLGTLEGICADCISTTRNGRLYSDEVWQHAFNDPIVKEHFKCGGIFGQLGHPKEDQSENEEFNCIAICMPEPPKKGPDGKLRGRWDILDTPNGRILKCLCDYGYKIGISSRGNGDIVENYDGTESVEPDTFEFKAFDAVLLPAVKEARLNLVTESLNDKDKKFKKALQESIDSSDDVDKAIMLKTLDDLGIDYIEPHETEGGEEDSIAVDYTDDIADSSGMDLVDNLQAALKEINDLKMQLFDLNEQISVSNTKETRLENQISKLQNALKKSRESSKVAEAMKHQLLSMKEQLENSVVEQQRQKKLAESYKSKLNDAKSTRTQLNESVETDKKVIESLQRKIKSLQESMDKNGVQSRELIDSLQQEVTELKNDSKLKHSQYTKKLTESTQQINKYKNIAQKAVDKYIECKCTALGISPNDVKNRLTESFSFKEIDEVCESLRGYNLNISKLPFQLFNVKNVSMKENLQQRKLTNPDDVVDNSLLDWIN